MFILNKCLHFQPHQSKSNTCKRNVTLAISVKMLLDDDHMQMG